MNKLRLDYFLTEDKKIYQDPTHFCFNTDTRLLATFCKVKKGERVLDIGCNNGALLYALDEIDVKELVGVEVNPEACQVARKNIDSFFVHPARIVCSRIQDFNDTQLFDVIVSNPPYFKQKSTHPDTQMDPRQYGRIEVWLTLEELIQHANRLLKSNGRFYFVHRPNRLNDIAKALYAHNFQIQHFQIAYDHSVAKSILIEARKESSCDCIIEEPIYIRK